MNERGNLLLIIGIVFVLILALPWLVVAILPQADLLIKIFLVFTIYMMVRGFVGPGALGILFTVILVYFLVLKYSTLSFSVWLLITVLGVGAGSIIVFGARQFFAQGH